MARQAQCITFLAHNSGAALVYSVPGRRCGRPVLQDEVMP